MDTYLPMREAALVGCAVATGAGAVFNAATARPGQSIAVFGAGGVGLSAISAAHAAGCHPIIAVDILALKLDFARTMGATHTIDSSRTDVGTAIDNIAHGGVDIAIEATGRPEVMVAALGSARQQGGCVVVIGNAPAGQTLVIDPKQLNMGKRLLGTWGGDSRPDIDYPRYSKLIVAGKLNVTPLISTTYSLRDINAALDDLENGVVCRPLIDFNL
jgi:S-(hydroxymethyl)glutathione dehydrogenase/alcohol dehydrogenase